MPYKKLIRDVKDFPKEGIVFKDITPIFENEVAFQTLIHDMADSIRKNFDFDKMALIDSRGFIFGAALSLVLNKPFCLIRKKGKLPSETISESYDLEYGTDSLEVHKDSIKKNEKVLIIDDLLATGGTAAAAEALVMRTGGVCVGTLCLIELSFLNGKDSLKGKFQSLISY